MALFLQVLGMVFVAELGDKTQFLMIAMASKYKIRDILLGVGGAVCVLNILAIALGTLLGGFLPTAVISIAAGTAFLCFAYGAVGGGEEGDGEKLSEKGKRGAALTVFCTFFIAELGDKTQLTALTLAASSSAYGFDIRNIISVFLGASLALFAADVLGLAVGYLIGKTLPSSLFAWISFGIFAVFGAVKLLGGFEEAFAPFGNARLYAVIATAVICVVFAALTLNKTFGAGTRGKPRRSEGKDKNVKV
ncbi:MAG: TMEM165/GDT1 family protein [Clostridia bacterium]|nr:TMEM165/GDT1 family protein [Clostridia bacterium]